jgi:predicted nucleotidyltransferase
MQQAAAVKMIQDIATDPIQQILPVVDAKLREIAETYKIIPLFAGLFGSQAKGYAGPDSDYDLYVVYQGALIQYVKVIDFETNQQRGEESLPTQITIEAQRNGSPVSVQLNFVSLDFFAQEIGCKSNIDFRMALDHAAWLQDDTEQVLNLISLLNELANSSYDAEKVKHTGLGHASKVVKKIKNNEDITPSELTDGLYRFFMAWGVTNKDLLPELGLNKTLTLKELLYAYLMSENVKDFQVGLLHNRLVDELATGKWHQSMVEWKGLFVRVVERLIPVIKERPALVPPPSVVDKSIEHRLQIVNALNEMFVGMLLKGGK